MTSLYALEKWTWTTDDFEQMGWHDVRVHALAEESENWELLLDIDYLFQWNQPTPGETYYSFWIAPCTLVFHNVADLHIDIEPISSNVMQISNVMREGPRPPRPGFENQNVQVWRWTVEFFNGAIEFESTGYTQFVRRAPVFNNRSQDLTLAERGGFGFDRYRTDSALEVAFERVGIRRGNILLLRSDEALNLVARARDAGRRILGVEAFTLTGDSVHPHLDKIADYSDAPDAWEAAAAFVRKFNAEDLYFEVVLD